MARYRPTLASFGITLEKLDQAIVSVCKLGAMDYQPTERTQWHQRACYKAFIDPPGTFNPDAIFILQAAGRVLEANGFFNEGEDEINEPQGSSLTGIDPLSDPRVL